MVLFKKSKIDWKVKLLFLILLHSKNNHVHILPVMLNDNTYVPTPKQLALL